MTTTNEFDSLERDLEAAFGLPVPSLEFRPAATAAPERNLRSHTIRFAAITAVAAAAVLGAVLLVPGFGSNGPQTASAQELIERSIAATDALAENPSNYHMVTVARSSGAETTTESWVGGTNRYRVEDRTTVNGITMVNGSVLANDEIWIYQGAENALVVAHGPRTLSLIHI